MMSIVPVSTEYTVSQYAQQATKAIEEIYNRGKLPIICGGTGLYIRAILYHMSFSNAVSDRNIRQELLEYVNKNGKYALHQMLHSIDEKTAARLHPNDVKRVIRALEVFQITGKPFSQQGNNKMPQKKDIYHTLLLGLQWPREKLMERDVYKRQGYACSKRVLYDASRRPDMPQCNASRQIRIPVY